MERDGCDEDFESYWFVLGFLGKLEVGTGEGSFNWVLDFRNQGQEKGRVQIGFSGSGRWDWGEFGFKHMDHIWFGSSASFGAQLMGSMKVQKVVVQKDLEGGWGIWEKDRQDRRSKFPTM